MATMANIGLEQIARLTSGATTAGTYFEYMAIGMGAVAEDAAHTTLNQEMTLNGGARGTTTNYYSGSGGYFAKWQRTYTFTGATSINETAMFNHVSAGTMLFRHKFGSTRSVGTGDTLTLTLSCQFST